MSRYMYDINQLVSELSALDWLEIVNKLNAIDKEMQKIPDIGKYAATVGYDEYTLTEYRHFVHEVSFYFSIGIKPIGLPIELFNLLKSVVERLVQEGQWNANALDSFQ